MTNRCMPYQRIFPRVRCMLALLGAIGMAGTVAGCVVVPARPVAYHPVVVRPYAYVVY